MKEIKNNSQGFTLIELLVVVVIIGILAAIALPQYQRVKEKTIMAEGVQIAKQIAEANQRYYLIHDEYTDDIKNLDIGFDNTANILNVDRFKTNNFIISTTGSAFDGIVLMQRIPLAESYYIYISRNQPNRFKCYIYSTATKIQKELCNKLNTDGHL